MYQNAGEKGCKHTGPDDPPRRRANKMKGHGTWDNDRPPVAGVVGRESGAIGLQVCHHSDRQTLQPFVEEHTRDDGAVQHNGGYLDRPAQLLTPLSRCEQGVSEPVHGHLSGGP
jgi:hypothetical protein